MVKRRPPKNKCQDPSCPPQYRMYSGTSLSHKKDIHQDYCLSVTYKGVPYDVRRDPSTGLYLCPCGSSQHSEYSARVFRNRMLLPEHPAVVPDEDLTDAPEDGHEVMEDVSDVPFLDSPPSLDGSNEGEEEDREDEGDDHDEEDGKLQPPTLLEDTPTNSPAAVKARLLEHALAVDPVHFCVVCLDCRRVVRLRSAHSHRQILHAKSFPLPSKRVLISLLISLGAQHNVTFPSKTAIAPIEGVEILKNGAKCGEKTCAERNKVFRNRAAVLTHIKSSHPTPKKERKIIEGIACHQIGFYRGDGIIYVEVDDSL